jgi:signal transduction histidine kinase
MNKLVTLFLRASIENKIRFIVLITSSVMLLSGLGMLLSINAQALKNRKVENLAVLHNVVSASNHSALIYRDYDSGIEKLEALRADTTVLFACMYDFDDKEFAVFKRNEKLDMKCPDSETLSYGVDDFKSDTAYIYKDIIYRDEKLGALYILASLQDINQASWRIWLFSLAAAAVAILVAYFISAWLLRFVAEPINSLLSTARAVSENHNYSVRAVKTSEDELGVLVDAFNYMLRVIHERDTAIVEAYEGLELRVIERTQQLEEARSVAEAANQAKSVFLTNMSHELRTPMHVVLSYSDFGMEEIADAERDELLKYFTRIHESGARLLALLNNLLDLSKLEAGKMVFDMRQADLRQPLDTVLKELNNLLENKSIQVLTVASQEFEPIAEFDRAKMIQVIYNLVSNAIKFTPENGQITIGFRQTKLPSTIKDGAEVDAIQLFVKDTGVGIPYGELGSVFDKFIQSTKTHTGAGGTGLGLAISKEIMREHAGDVWCENNEGAGATFTFVLPVAREFVE